MTLLGQVDSQRDHNNSQVSPMFRSDLATIGRNYPQIGCERWPSSDRLLAWSPITIQSIPHPPVSDLLQMKFEHDSFLLKISQWFSIIPRKDRIFNIVCKALDELSPPLSPVSPSRSAPVPDPQSPRTAGWAAGWICDTPLGFHRTIRLLHCASPSRATSSASLISLRPPQHFVFGVHCGPFAFLPNIHSPCLSRVLVHSSGTHPGTASTQALPQSVPASWVKGASYNILPKRQTWRDMKGHHLVTWKPEESVQMSLISKRNGGFALCHSQRRLKGVVLTLNRKFCFSPPD